MAEKHGNTICPLYGEEVIKKKDDKCTLCGTTENGKSIICYICEDGGRRRCSYPIDKKYKSNILSHVKEAHE